MPDAISFPPREEFTDIRVAPDGTWYAKGGRKIINRDILRYFKRGLNRDEKGIYIYNEFGPFREKGYIKIEGPPVLVSDFDCDTKKIYLDNDDELTLDSSLNLVMTLEDRPFVFYEKLKTWAGFHRGAFFRFMEVLSKTVEETGELRFCGVSVASVENISWDSGT